eukprot:CAMPEP_0177728320 /NCGR_PEP_ID=MMETSP0484_2-20121128/20821_1 /TAXON_ID=354590 /ORGANISM="Rhodomonas lens, Strain RHODO" /LENGTH=117 /DNA_ID=CAMNT_0019241091 /DNA_START=142 /DNA_END=495 /DNA_ORIENTATION=+
MTHKNFSNLTNGTISLEVAGSDGEPWTAELPPNATVQIPEFVLDRGLRMQSGFSMAWSEPISELSANCIDDSSFQASPEAGAGKTLFVPCGQISYRFVLQGQCIEAHLVAGKSDGGQ